MLVLYRKSEESVIVYGFKRPEREFKVTVLGVTNGLVKLGVEINSDDPIDQPHALIRSGAGRTRRKEVSMQGYRV